MKKVIYYLPGHGGRITTGLGEGLIERGFVLAGRETVEPFRALPFQEQIELVASDLRKSFWSRESYLIAVSYGAYLFLHAQAQMSSYPGCVLLLSPIVGQFATDEISIGFIPPRAKKLKHLAEQGEYPRPFNCQIHVGSEDWQSNPVSVSEFGAKTGIPVTIAPGMGHRLDVGYVSKLLDQWLSI